MKKQITDEQIDALMRRLMNKARAEETLLDEIADSPATWWGVQRKIITQKAEKLSAWPPVGKVIRWLFAGGVLTTAVVLILSFFGFRQDSTDDRAQVAKVRHSMSDTQSAPESVKPIIDIQTENKPDKDVIKQVAHRTARKARKIEKRGVVKTTEMARAGSSEEIKTDFIALSYARDPESGQIVRVKVPSSMMVSLGLVTSVKTPSAMIDAEVLVGDDGLSRAIRFIR